MFLNSFKAYLLSEKANLHITHIEDAVLYGGVTGVRGAINNLREIRDVLAGNTKAALNATIKLDGAPAVTAGYVPSGYPDKGKFFVGKKGVFNKTPLYYTTNAEIDAAGLASNLVDIFKTCLKELPNVIKSGIYQGDLLFTQSMLKKNSIAGESYITFQPNTIVYAIPEGTPEADEVNKASMGMAFHTRYTGDTFSEMKASYDVKLSEFKKSPAVWLHDVEIKDLSGTATLTKADTDDITKKLSKAGKIFQKIAGSTIRQLEANQTLAKTIETFNNTYVRANEPIKDTKKHVENLIRYIHDKYEKEIEKRKTDKGKAAQTKAREEFLSFFDNNNKKNLQMMFDLQKALVEAKLVVIKKLDMLNKTKTFISTKDGYKVTSHEGYVVVDKLTSNTYKLVDRLEFSWANFSPEVIKGWS